MRTKLVIDMLIPLICLATVLVCASASDESVFYPHSNGIFNCAKCKKGTFIKSHCTSDGGHPVCEDCPSGSFNSELNALMACKPCTVCSDTGRNIQSKCSNIVDAVCICPDKHYWTNGPEACFDCTPPMVVTRSTPSDLCVNCRADYYYNATLEECASCKTCDESETVVHSCNTTHNSVCFAMVASTIPPGKDKSGEIPIVVWVVLVVGLVVLIVVVGLICYRKKKGPNGNVAERTVEEQAPLQQVNRTSNSIPQEEASNSLNHTSNNIPQEDAVPSHNILLNSLNHTSNSIPQEEVSNSREPEEWLKHAICILNRDVDNLELFAVSLPDIEDFKCYVKWKQIKEDDINIKLNTFMNDWHMTDPAKATLSEIIKVLQESERNDVIENMKQHEILGILIKRSEPEEWLKHAICELNRDVDNLELFASLLPDIGDFKCSVKWKQIQKDEINIKLNTFMNGWHMADPAKATLSEIIKVLKKLNRNDVIENMKQHEILGILIKRSKLQEKETKLLIEVNYADEDHKEPTSTTQETEQVTGECVISGDHNDIHNMTRTYSSDDEQTNLKELCS